MQMLNSILVEHLNCILSHCRSPFICVFPALLTTQPVSDIHRANDANSESKHRRLMDDDSMEHANACIRSNEAGSPAQNVIIQRRNLENALKKTRNEVNSKVQNRNTREREKTRREFLIANRADVASESVGIKQVYIAVSARASGFVFAVDRKVAALCMRCELRKRK